MTTKDALSDRRSDKLVTVNWIIFWLDTDTARVSEREMARLKQMFQAMKASRIRLTLDLMGDGSPHKLPIGAIGSLGEVDVDGRRGWHGTINLVYLFGKNIKQLLVLTLMSMSWRILDGCDDDILGTLTISAPSKDDFHRCMRLLTVSDCQQFDLSLSDTTDKWPTKWTKLRTVESGRDECSMVAHVASEEYAEYLEKFLLLQNPDDLAHIDIVTEKSDQLFIMVYEKLRLILQKFERYTVREVEIVDDGKMIDVNRIVVDGTVLSVELSTKLFVELPAGERFTSIGLIVNGPEASKYAEWLALCILVEYLYIRDRGADILGRALKLVALNPRNEEISKRFN